MMAAKIAKTAKIDVGAMQYSTKELTFLIRSKQGKQGE